MTEPTLIVRHPSPVRYVPQGGRATRHAFEPILTPATLRRAEAGSFDPLPLTRDPGSVFWRRGLHAHEGTLWKRATGWDPAAEGNRPVPLDAFLAYLRGDGSCPKPAERALDDALLGTPLLACHWDPYAVRDRPDRGEPIADARSRTDDADRSAEALRLFLDESVRIAGDGVWLRATPMAVVKRDANQGAAYGMMDCLAPEDRIVLRSNRPIPVRADLGNEILAAVPGGLRKVPLDPDTFPPSGLLRDDDLRQVACQGPILLAAIGGELRRFARSAAGGARATPEADRILEDMAPLAMRGRIGAILPREVEGTLLALERDARILDRLNGIAGPDGRSVTIPGLALLADHIRAHALPRLETRSPEDDAAIGLLAP